MSKIQFPSVAGMFYPAQTEVLIEDIEAMLQQAGSAPAPIPKALIAPHAGYIYSGPVAASAYATLTPAAEEIQRVIVLAPSHRVGFKGLAASSADYFRTPAGDLEVDRDAVNSALELPQVQLFDEAFSGEHALEVQLPFLQQVLTQFKLVPFIVGDATARQVADVLERLWGGRETLIVISSDLSHFLTYDKARERDQATSQAIADLAFERIGYEDACGRIPVSGLLLAAREKGLHSEILDQRNSGDTAGDKNRVVGYGAYLFH